jgi:hypothetical protein
MPLLGEDPGRGHFKRRPDVSDDAFLSTQGHTENSDASFPWPTDMVGPVSREMPSYVKGASDNITAIELKMNIQLMKSATINASFWIAKCGASKSSY